MVAAGLIVMGGCAASVLPSLTFELPPPAMPKAPPVPTKRRRFVPCACAVSLPVCACCGGAARPFVASVPVLRLEDYRPQLEEVWQSAELPRQVRDLIARYSSTEMPTVPLAYPTDWGIEGAGPLAGMRLDAYVEVKTRGLL